MSQTFGIVGNSDTAVAVCRFADQSCSFSLDRERLQVVLRGRLPAYTAGVPFQRRHRGRPGGGCPPATQVRQPTLAHLRTFELCTVALLIAGLGSARPTSSVRSGSARSVRLVGAV